MKCLTFVILSLTLVACAKKSGSAAVSASAALTKPSDCTLASTGAISMRDYGSKTGSTYDCNVPELSPLSCQFLESDDGHRELDCENLSANIDASIAKAFLGQNGTRFFFSRGRTLGSAQLVASDWYDLGVLYRMRCTLAEHNGDATDSHFYQDVQCTDDELP